MSLKVTSRKQFGNACYYVLANDSFMSGWGGAADATNVVVLPCANREEAEIVVENARARAEMRRVRVVCRAPRMRAGVIYSLMDRESASRWYTRGGFLRGDRE